VYGFGCAGTSSVAFVAFVALALSPMFCGSSIASVALSCVPFVLALSPMFCGSSIASVALSSVPFAAVSSSGGGSREAFAELATSAVAVARASAAGADDDGAPRKMPTAALSARVAATAESTRGLRHRAVAAVSVVGSGDSTPRTRSGACSRPCDRSAELRSACIAPTLSTRRSRNATTPSMEG